MAEQEIQQREDDVINAVVVYKKGVVRVSMDRRTYDHMLEFALSPSGCVSMQYSGTDVNGRGFRLEVGSNILALYAEWSDDEEVVWAELSYEGRTARIPMSAETYDRLCTWASNGYGVFTVIGSGRDSRDCAFKVQVGGHLLGITAISPKAAA